MSQVFISYSTRDKFFCELLALKLEAADIDVWRDVTDLRGGEEWRASIDRGIAGARVVILALSPNSVQSHYVTYEWARALALGKTLVPVLLAECDRHPQIERIQFVDFRNHNDHTWQSLIQLVAERLDDPETEVGTLDLGAVAAAPTAGGLTQDEEHLAAQIIGYVNRKGFRMISYDRVRKEFGIDWSDDKLAALVARSDTFVGARLSGDRAGLALI